MTRLKIKYSTLVKKLDLKICNMPLKIQSDKRFIIKRPKNKFLLPIFKPILKHDMKYTKFK